MGEKRGNEMGRIKSLTVICLTVFSTFVISAPCLRAADLGSWTSRANMITPRLLFAAVTYGGRIYAIGGSDISGGGTERATSIVEIYDPSTDSWVTGTPMPAPKYHTGAVVIDNRIYVMGHDSRLFSYDPAHDAWAEHASIPADAAYGFGIGVVNGKIYAIRGSPDYPSGVYWTYCYDPTSDTWTSKAPLPFTRSTDSVATLNGKLYAIGGIEPTGGWVHCTRVDVYDPATDSWELDSIARLSVPRTHLEADTPVVNGRIYVIGGWNGVTALSTVEEYDPATNSWRTLAPMPTARYGLATAVVDGNIYAIGGDWGGAGGNLQSANEEFTLLKSPAPTPVGGKWVPMDKRQILAPLIGWVSSVTVITAFLVGAKRARKRKN
jgi:N-acetylneuraminic acid mutarotase